MTPPRPTMDIGRPVRVVETCETASFRGRLGTIVETKVKGRGSRVRVQLDHDEGYTWWFAAREVEMVE